MASVGWRQLRPGIEADALVGIDFTLAKVRAQATFGDLATLLPDAYGLWASDETTWPTTPGQPRSQLDAWLRNAPAAARAVLGFCASSSLAGVLAARLRSGSRRPAVVLLDPVTVGPATLIDQAGESLRRLTAEADEPVVETDGLDPGELATLLARRYAEAAAKVGAAQSIPPSIVDQLCRRVETNLRFLTLCWVAWSAEWAAPDLVVLSRDHEAPAPLRDVPAVRLPVAQNDLLAHPDTAGAVVGLLGP